MLVGAGSELLVVATRLARLVNVSCIKGMFRCSRTRATGLEGLSPLSSWEVVLTAPADLGRDVAVTIPAVSC